VPLGEVGGEIFGEVADECEMGGCPREGREAAICIRESEICAYGVAKQYSKCGERAWGVSE
jgi:hypothetical protein